MGFLDDIRTLFAQTADARRLGFDRGRFSFNTGQGNCESCKGTGMQKLEMDFLPPCYVPCETCRGKRYNAATLTVRYKGKTIADVLQMDFAEAAEFFESQPRISDPLKLLSETGLGYLTLGQASNTLSGGEAQRLKLVTELIKGRRVSRNALMKGRELPGDLYLIEEPSIACIRGMCGCSLTCCTVWRTRGTPSSSLNITRKSWRRRTTSSTWAPDPAMPEEPSWRKARRSR